MASIRSILVVFLLLYIAPVSQHFEQVLPPYEDFDYPDYTTMKMTGKRIWGMPTTTTTTTTPTTTTPTPTTTTPNIKTVRPITTSTELEFHNYHESNEPLLSTVNPNLRFGTKSGILFPIIYCLLTLLVTVATAGGAIYTYRARFKLFPNDMNYNNLIPGELFFTADQFRYQGPLEIKKNPPPVLDSDTPTEADPNPPNTHFQFAESDNVVYDIGSDVEKVVES